MFSEILVKHLQINNISPYEVAKRTGISQGLMGQYKLGNKTPTIKNLTRIADCLNVSIDYLVGRTDNPEINK